MSAQQLSDATGGLVSRSVIANIESGRRTDVSIDELFYLAHALGVNPMGLALPIDTPEASIQLSGTESREVWQVLAHVVRDHRWGQLSPAGTEAQVRVANVIRGVLDYEYHTAVADDAEATRYVREQLANDLLDSGVTLESWTGPGRG
jgi:transcriptional regulator with XRE-family HTH domain